MLAQRLVDEASRLIDYGGNDLVINYINEAQSLLNDRDAKSYVGLAAEITRARYYNRLEKTNPSAHAKMLTDQALKVCVDSLNTNFARTMTPSLVPSLMGLAQLHRDEETKRRLKPNLVEQSIF